MTVPRYRTLFSLGIGALCSASAGALIMNGQAVGSFFVLAALVWFYLAVGDFSHEIARLQDLVNEERKKKLPALVRFETFGEEAEMQVIR